MPSLWRRSNTSVRARIKQWVAVLFLAVLVGGWEVCVGLAERPGTAEPPAGMAYVAVGVYTPFFQDESAGVHVLVKAFYLDRYPITNARYLAFVLAQPE